MLVPYIIFDLVVDRIIPFRFGRENEKYRGFEGRERRKEKRTNREYVK